MANVLSRGNLFPPHLTNELFNLVKGKSSLAILSQQSAIPFNGTTLFTFNLDNEVDVVAENDPKSNGGGTMGSKNIVPIKIEYGMRVSDEFLYASEEYQLSVLQAFADGFATKAAKGLDLMALHGFNPRTMSKSVNVIGNNNFDDQVNQTVTATASANADMESAVALVQGSDYEVTGAIISPTFKASLARETYATDGRPLFPELSWGGSPQTLNGLRVDFNATVSAHAAGGSAADHVILGNFRDYFRWGVAKDVGIEVIEYGNPDNDAQAGDLKGHNQIYLRGEMYVGWGILFPEAFARITP